MEHLRVARRPSASCAVGVALMALVTLAPQAGAQPREELPRTNYYLALEDLYRGEYRSAEKGLRRETTRGLRTVQPRWVDSICYHALLGEVLFHGGRTGEALAEFDQACQILLTYPDWLLRVKFQQPLRADANLARRAVPWGRSDRRFALGQFSGTEPVFIGQLDNSQVIREGGVVATPQYWRINPFEIVRASALAMRRRNEILGPLGKHDPISRELADEFSRGGLAARNHWSQVLVDLQRGIALAGIGRVDEAAAALERAAVIDGQFDHPLTSVALLEQGRLAFDAGKGAMAAKLLAEASFSAYYFSDRDVITESLLLGWINYVAQGGQGVYPPLPAAIAWAQVNRMQHIAVKLRLAEAESLLWAGQLSPGAASLEEANRRIGEMRSGRPGIQATFVQAISQLLQGRMEPSANLLEQALGAQANSSLRNFQILRTSELFDSRQASPRVAAQLYEALLADPTPIDWTVSPLDAMAVLKTPHDGAFDRWFVAAIERKEAPLAFEIAEQTKRRRYLSRQALGGRLLALRTILEAPLQEISPQGVLERQQFLASFPAYRQLGVTSEQIQTTLREGPIASEGDAWRALNDRYQAWDKNSEARARILLELALRRVPSSLEFPPLRKFADVQQSLAEGEHLIVFHGAAGNQYGFQINNRDLKLWQLADERELRTAIGTLLRSLGNFGASKTLSTDELTGDEWREAAREVYALVFGPARFDLNDIESMVIVPDDVLWYLPFELLIADKEEAMLIERLPIRYGPLAALVAGDGTPSRRVRHTGIVATKLAAATPGVGEEALQALEAATTGPLRLPSQLPVRAGLVEPLLDMLINLDDAEPRDGAYGWNLLPVSKGKAGALQSWFGLPYGGPQRIIATGIATAAEQGLKNSRRGGARARRSGEEMFDSMCELMSSGTSTILLSRWRTMGRTNLELVREFVQELPHIPAAEAWQRAVTLAREAPLDPQREPRLKASDDDGELLTADHPLLWAGYLLVDRGALQAPPEPAKEVEKKPGRAQKPEADKPVANTKPAPDDNQPGDARALPPPRPEFEKPNAGPDSADDNPVAEMPSDDADRKQPPPAAAPDSSADARGGLRSSEQ